MRRNARQHKKTDIKSLIIISVIVFSLLIPAFTVLAEDYGFKSKGASYVAERLNKDNKIEFNNNYRELTWDEGENWKKNAEELLLTVDKTPKKGSVAWYKDETECWVAWVKEVNADETIQIEGMDEDEYSEEHYEKTIDPNALEKLEFIHFKDIEDEPETTAPEETTQQVTEQPTTTPEIETTVPETTTPQETEADEIIINQNLTFTGYMYWPLYGYGVECISSGYGYRTGEYSGFHAGIDIECPEGTPIYACDAGTVVGASYSDSAGNYTVIAHEGLIFTEYMHQSKMVVKEGDYVQAGQLIGYVGNTGWSTGSHLHIGVMVGGFGAEYRVNPCEYLGIKNVTVISDVTTEYSDWKAPANTVGCCTFYQGDANAKLVGPDGTEYKYYNYYDLLQLKVEYKGKYITGTAAGIFRQTGRKVVFTDDQNYGMNPWGIGEHAVKASFCGKEYEAIVNIVENPIESITIAQVKIPAETGGAFMSYYDSTTKTIKNYAYYSYAPVVKKVAVTLKDGYEIDGSGIIIGTPDQIAELFGLDVKYSVKTDQSYANQWKPGSVYTAKFNFLGLSTDFQVAILKEDMK